MTARDTDASGLTGIIGMRLPRTRRGRTNLAIAAVAAVLTLLLILTIPHFLQVRNILNILEQLGILGFMAVGMTFVMVAGGIDLSMYTVVSAASVVGASAMVAGYPPVVGCALMLAVGLIFGVVNGTAIAIGRMTPFIVTLSTMVLAQGFAIWFTSAQSISGLPESYLDDGRRQDRRISGARHHHHSGRHRRRHRSGAHQIRSLALPHRQ